MQGKQIKMDLDSEFLQSFDHISNEVHNTAVNKGFWDEQTAEEWILNDYLDLEHLKEKDVLRKREKAKQGVQYIFENIIDAYEAGQKNPPPNKGEKIALMHSELSEMLEGVRKPGPDKHCPEFTNEEIELADDFIRGMDYAKKYNLRLGEAILAKHEYNTHRPHKHGKEF